MSVKLIQAGDFVTREYPVEVNDFTIGRDFTCDLRLDHGRISRNHCRILKRGNRVLVEALYSTAGTAVNQQILDPSHPPVEIHDGDHLWVGPEHFQFSIVPDSVAPARPSSVSPRRSEDSALENPLVKDVQTAQSRVANQVLERLSVPVTGGEAKESAPATAVEGAQQGHLDVTRMGPVSLVRLLPKAIVADTDIRSITEGLDELIDSGQNCITLHLGNVERLSSQVIGEVFQVYQRCKSNGGMLKICKVSPEVAGVFALMNMQRHIEIFPDEKLALKSHWPRQQPESNIPKAALNWPLPEERKAVASPGPAAPQKQVRLIAEVGRAKGRAVDIRGPRFVIGRGQECQLRPNSNGISRHHAAIEQRDGRVFVRDLGTQLGTTLNGRVLHDEEAEAVHGDRLQIEVLRFTVAIEDPTDPAAPSPKDESAGGWFGEQSTDSSADTTIMALPEFAAAAPRPAAPFVHDPLDPNPRPLRYLNREVVNDVLVVALLTPDMTEESVLSGVRAELETLLAQPGAHRIVLRFDRVKTLSRGAVVMFLARAQHLIQMRGSMRFCGVSASVMEYLDKTQLPLLIEAYPTLGEALKTPW